MLYLAYLIIYQNLLIIVMLKLFMYIKYLTNIKISCLRFTLGDIEASNIKIEFNK